MLALGNIVETIDRACDLTVLIPQDQRVSNDIPPLTILALDEDFKFIRLEGFSLQRARHRTLFWRHEPAIWIEDLVGATIPFARIILLGLASPQIHSTMVVFLDQPVGIAAIDGHRDQLEQVTISLFRSTQGLYRLLVPGDIYLYSHSRLGFTCRIHDRRDTGIHPDHRPILSKEASFELERSALEHETFIGALIFGNIIRMHKVPHGSAE